MKMGIKRLMVCVFVIAAFLGYSIAAFAEGIIPFTDSAGRQVGLPLSIQRIAPSGQLAQIMLYSLCPDKLTGWSIKPGNAFTPYLPETMKALPVFGQYYGKNVSLNLEALILARPDVIIDIGERKPSIKEDMDSIQQQTGIPVVFIEATLDTMPAAYEMLGRLAGMEKEATELCKYASDTVRDVQRLRKIIDDDQMVRVYYAQGEDGLATDPSGSIHADVIDLIGAKNVADITFTSGAGMNKVSMEQVLAWRPDVVLFARSTAFQAAVSDPIWNQLKAAEDGRFYEIPEEPFHWLGSPPSINRLLGIKWLGNLLYPDVYVYDMAAEAQKFFRLFYHFDLSSQAAKNLMAHSTYLEK